MENKNDLRTSTLRPRNKVEISVGSRHILGSKADFSVIISPLRNIILVGGWGN